jgi:hypothetical protein
LADAEEVPVREVVSVEEPTDEIAQLERLLHVTTGERNRRADPWRVNRCRQDRAGKPVESTVGRPRMR